MARYVELCKLSADYIEWEIIVADDGSGDDTVVANAAIGKWPHCEFIARPENAGRAAIRNFLARQACYPTVLFIDADMLPCDREFIVRYISRSTGDNVIIGGTQMCQKTQAPKGNLRYKYESHAAPDHTAEKRRRYPYQYISVANILAPRDIMLQYPLDERFTRYGYEDVIFGKTLEQAGIPIEHIDNPVVWQGYGSNEATVRKIEQSLDTLRQFADELRGYSRLLDLDDKLRRWHIAPIVRQWHKTFGLRERNNLLGLRPSLILLNLYKIGYFCNTEEKKGVY